jgi:hypothetical protein
MHRGYSWLQLSLFSDGGLTWNGEFVEWSGVCFELIQQQANEFFLP